MIEEVS